MNSEDNSRRFDNYVSRKALEGYTIVDKNADSHIAVVEKRREMSTGMHLVHGLLTFSTCGLWAIVWIIMYNVSKKPNRIRISFDDSGNMIEEKV